MRLLLCFLHVLHLTKSLGGGTEVEVNEIASAVGSAIDAFSAVNETFSSGGSVPVETPVSSLKSFQPNDTFASVYEEFVKTEGVIDGIYEHFFELNDYGIPISQKKQDDWTDDTHPEFGNVTFSLNGWTFNDEPGGGTTIDKISVKFESGEDILSVTETNMDFSQVGDAFTTRVSIAYVDSREYANGDWVRFSTEITTVLNGDITYSISDLRYKGQPVSEEDTAKVESILMGENPGIEPEPEEPISNEELLTFTSTFIDDAVSYGSLGNSLILEDVSTLRAVNVSLDLSGMKTVTPVNVSVGFSQNDPTIVITFKGDLDIYSTEPKKMGTIHFADFKVWSPDNNGSSVLSDGEFDISWEPNYEHNEKYYTQDVVARECYTIIMQLMRGQSVDGVSTVGNVTDKVEISFEDYQLGDYQVADIRINTVKTYDNGRVYQDGSEITVSAIVDSEAYSADISIASGSVITSIDSAELSGFSSSASLDDINEELNGKFVEFYEAYSDIESGIVSQPQPSVPA